MDFNNKCCLNCANCVAIGEGDHICISDEEPVLIIEEYVPNDNYLCCGYADYESWDDEDDE